MKKRSPKRKSPKRKSPKRKSPKRKSPKRILWKKLSKSAKQKNESKSGWVKFSFSTDWIIYTKDNCPYCLEAKNLLREKNKSFRAYRGEDYGEEIEKKLKRINQTNFKTWPKIFNPEGKFIGGYSDLKMLFSF